MAENFPIKGISLQIQEVQVPSRLSKNKSTSIHILMQFGTSKTKIKSQKQP